MNALRYWACRVHPDGDFGFVGWYIAEIDGFLRDEHGHLVIAGSVDALGVPVEDAVPVDYDFDRIEAWCAAPDVAGIECDAFLNVWNFFDDLAGLHTGSDTEYVRLSRASEGVYDKLFWGNNLAAVTPPGERFEPSWSSDDLAELRRVLEAGLSELRTEMRERALSS